MRMTPPFSVSQIPQVLEELKDRLVSLLHVCSCHTAPCQVHATPIKFIVQPHVHKVLLEHVFFLASMRREFISTWISLQIILSRAVVNLTCSIVI